MAFGGQQSRRRAEWTLRMGRALSMCPAHHRCSEPPGENQEGSEVQWCSANVASLQVDKTEASWLP